MKKTAFSTLLLILLALSADGQQVLKTSTSLPVSRNAASINVVSANKPTANFFDIQNRFYKSYTESAIEENEHDGEERDGGYEKFKRWEYYWEQRVGKSGQFPNNDVLVTESERYKTQSKSAERTTSTSATWTFMGPTSSTGSLSPYMDIGRVNCIAFHPTIANTFWVGTPGGGLWKTTNGGATWSTNTDYFPVLGISDIAIDPTNPNNIYVATGDGDNAYSLSSFTVGGGDTKSIGVLKSTDGGTTWSTTGLSWSTSSQILIRRLLIDPTNPLILIAATSDGIWRTANGGTSWTNQATGWYMDLAFNPTNHNIVYGTSFSNAGHAQILRSTDNGVTWFQTSLTGINRIKLAVSAAWPSFVEAVCVDTSTAAPGLGGLEGIWYSNDNGATFTQYFVGTSSNNILNGAYNASGSGGQGEYDLACAINPANAGEIFIGGVNTWKSTDTGVIWYLNNYWVTSGSTSAPTVHSDKHWIAYHPLVAGTIFECNDGGLFKTTNGGLTWTDITSGMGISEIYRIGTSATVANDVICGIQDNGSKELYSGSWNNRVGGDGMECIIDYTNNNIQYASYASGKIYKTTNHWVSYSQIAANGGPGTAGTVNEAGEWVTPYVMHPTNNNTLLVGKSQVYQTTNAGTTWTQLGTIAGASGDIRAIAYAPSTPTTIYVAYDTVLYKTTNAGVTWTPMVSSGGNVITYITVSPINPLDVWITLSGYTAGAKVYGSSDGGATWSNWSGTLPNVPINCIVYANVCDGGLYIGTDLGVYYWGTSASTTDWIPFNTGLPNVVVNELEISSNDQLWAATFGRGLWKSYLYSTATCPTPTGLSTSGVTTSAATLHWTAVSGAASYNIQYRLGTGSWTTVTSTTNSYSITSGLTACSTYQFQVQAVCNCSPTPSSYSSIASFITAAPACNTPSILPVTGITASSATLNWSSVSGAVSYKIQYRIGTGAWTPATSTTTSYTLTGLTSSSTYQYQVQSVCSCPGSLSSWTSTNTFNTLASVGLNPINTPSSIMVYPNPTNSVINIDAPCSVDIRLTSSDGKLMLESKNVREVNLSSLPNGIYLLTIFDAASGMKVKTERVTKLGN